MRVSEILDEKGRHIRTVRPTLTIGALAHRFKEENVGAMIVSADGKSLDGIVSERDVINGLAEVGSAVDSMRVSDLCRDAVHTCKPDDTISKVAGVMTMQRIRHVPVVEDGKLVGIISIGDVLKHRVVEMELEANVLRDVAIAVR
ncbi:MAG: CBS domain-containing protein [Alphaproteobacteria bacterium]|nr:CBS domain-containing protein [Alphaproteobacteria bacterium]